MLRVPRDVLVYIYRWHGRVPQLLMLHRAPERGGFWHWVSGAPEHGESDVEAAIRETREETGLDVAESIFALGFRYAYQLNPQRAARWLELYGPGVEQILVETFAAEAAPAWEAGLDFEHDEYAWCTFAEAERRLYWPGAPEGLEHLRATLDVLHRRLQDASQRGQPRNP